MLGAPTGGSSTGDVFVRVIDQQQTNWLEVEAFGESIKEGSIRFAGSQIA